MSNLACKLHVLPPRRVGDFLRLEAELSVGKLTPRNIWFEVETLDRHVPEISSRPFLLAGLVTAMRAGLPLEADAPVDRGTLRNLQVWQAAFSAWRPLLMSHVPIHAPLAKEQPPSPGALTAFSGGADSHYTLLKAPAEGSVLKAGALVHGFDIPLVDEDAYARAHTRVHRTLSARGLLTHRIKTNVRSLDRAYHLSWQHETHGPYLAAALSCLEPWYGTAIIPSSFGHDYPVIPWGSNVLTDTYLGGDRQSVVHHGAEKMRIEKLIALVGEKDFAESARVCYLNDHKDLNCGRCYKCAVLQVTFWVFGVSQPAAFPVRASLEDLRSIDLPLASYRYTYRTLADLADKAGMGDVAEAMRMVLRQSEAASSPWRGRLAGWLRRLPMR